MDTRGLYEGTFPESTLTIDQVLDQHGLFLPDTLADPYPTYHRLRGENPVHWSETIGAWILTRYADVAAALRDSRLSSRRTVTWNQLPSDDRGNTLSFSELAPLVLGWSDPPDHTRLRKLMSKAFTPALVEGLRGQILRIVDELLSEVESAGRIDVIRDLASPLPLIVISDILGVPAEERAFFKQMSDELLLLFATGRITPDQAARGQRGAARLLDYFRDIVHWHRRHPTDDLLSALIAAEEQGDVLSEDELLINCVMLLFASHETTSSLIGNGMLALLRHPDQLRQLRSDPTLIATAVEELLRYESPLQRSERVAAEDLDIAGRRIARGQRVWSMIGAANRDPAQFPEPDRLDLARQPNRHLAFGYGIHFCLGAPLARVEGQVAIGAMMRRWPSLRLGNESVQWQDNMSIRCPRRLLVEM